MIKGDIRDRVKEWADKLPRKIAARQLIRYGISISAAQKLLTGTYPSAPKTDMRLRLERAMLPLNKPKIGKAS